MMLIFGKYQTTYKLLGTKIQNYEVEPTLKLNRKSNRIHITLNQN